MKRCGECGSKDVSLKNIKGSEFPWKDYPSVTLLFDMNVLVCGHCGNQILGSKDIAALDENIVQSINQKQKEAIEALVKLGVEQKTLARILGKSPEYISMLKNGAKQASFSLFVQLQIFKDVPSFIEKYTGVSVPIIRAQASWSTPVESMLLNRADVMIKLHGFASRSNRHQEVRHLWHIESREESEKSSISPYFPLAMVSGGRGRE